MRLQRNYIPILVLECWFLCIGEVFCQPPLLSDGASTPSDFVDWPASVALSLEDDRTMEKKQMRDSNSADLSKFIEEAETETQASIETMTPILTTDQRITHSVDDLGTTISGQSDSAESVTWSSSSDHQNVVENNFASELPDHFVSSSGWRPIPNPKVMRARMLDSTTFKTSEVPSSTPFPEDVGSTVPFSGSPPLSESGWIPIPHPKPMRKGRTRVIYEHDYDDIITAPPPPRHGESFELVVGASLSGGSTHPRPSFNHSSPLRVKIVEPPRSVINKRNAGDDVMTTTKSTSSRSSVDPGYELLPEGNWTFLEKTTLVQKFLTDIPADKLVIRQPVSISQIGSLYSGESWPDFQINTPQPIVYLPDDRESYKESSFSLSSDYDSRVPFITRITKPPAWTDTSAINHMFTIPKLEFHPTTLDDTSLDKMLDPFSEMVPPLEARSNPSDETEPLIKDDASPQQVAQKTLPGSVIINTARGPQSMFAYSAVEPAEGFGRHPDNARSLNKQQKLDTKHFVSENESLQTKSEEKNKTSLAVQPFMSTESLAYILIGACCGLSILCLLVVIVTMRCRKNMDEQKSFSTIHHSGLINGWVADPYPKEPVLVYENNILRSANDVHTIQIDPWFNKNRPLHDLSSIDFHGPSASSIPPHGVRFETLGIGPCKQLKRTTVIPGNSTALITDGHTNVMRELSSVSSASSSASSSSSVSSSENYHPYQPIEEAPESLDIQEDLFDHTSSAIQRMQNNALPKISEEPSSMLVSGEPSLPDGGRTDADGPDSMIHWSTNDERLI